MAYINQIRELDLELSSHCNANCPKCPRVHDFHPEKPGANKPNHLDFSILSNLVKQEILNDLKVIHCCGNFGDPILYPHLLDFMKLLEETHPGIVVVIHTNGGIGNPKLWEGLGKIKGIEIEVLFSIDGLKDTNPIYRRNVDWDTIKRNIDIFVSHGGNAIWQFIHFPYNGHQIEEARNLSQQWGMSNFILRKNNGPNINPMDFPPDYPVITGGLERFDEATDLELAEKFNYLEEEAKKIECHSQKQKLIYVDAEGYVWPCCYVAEKAANRKRLPEREWLHRKILDTYQEKFNYLGDHELKDILNHQWLGHDLEKSWTTSFFGSPAKNQACAEECGKCL